MNRRRYLQTTATAGAIGLAGCLDSIGLGDDDVPRPEGYGDNIPVVESPPEAVYIPTHREGMIMPDPIRAGEYAVGPMIGQPHPFWLVTGQQVELVDVQPGDSVHLMVTIWDPETDTVLPTDEGLRMEIYKHGDLIEELPPWSMLSQSMGFHFGDNVPLDGDGTYEVHIDIPPMGTHRTGAFGGRFEEGATATFEFTFDQQLRDAIFEGIDWVDEENWGQPGAIEPGHGTGHDDEHDGDNHDDEHDDGHGDHHDDGHGGELGHPPFSELPSPADLPGTPLGDLDSDEFPKAPGDAELPATIVDDGSRFTAEPYLLVSPRTPYNRNPLPATALTAVVREDGDVIAEPQLRATLDDDAGYHYGAGIESLESADSVTIAVDAPPQTARHQGYETAFVEMPDVEYSIDR